MTILTRKFDKIYLLKLSCKTTRHKFDAFLRRNSSFVFTPKEGT